MLVALATTTVWRLPGEVVPVSFLTGRLGRLSDARMREVCQALSIAVDGGW